MHRFFALCSALYRPLLILTVVLYAAFLVSKIFLNEKISKRFLYATVAVIVLLVLIFILGTSIVFFVTSRANDF